MPETFERQEDRRPEPSRRPGWPEERRLALSSLPVGDAFGATPAAFRIGGQPLAL